MPGNALTLRRMTCITHTPPSRGMGRRVAQARTARGRCPRRGLDGIALASTTWRALFPTSIFQIRGEFAMAHTAADTLIDTIHDWGVDVIFGLPGDGINGIMEALRTRQDRIRFIQVRHEEAAAFMACAYAKYTG